MQVQEAQRVPNRTDAKRPTPRHILIKIPKVKGKEILLKAAKEKKLLYFALYNVHFSAQIFEGKIRMCIIHGLY